ncbi:preprotein translocase, SecE subunit [Leptospira broomii serovar Hurstbridge str. 5399]|uniref:Protein translocase subunit SecE n=4 Tax=Leptospira TaxID=171 RepID=V6HXF6_9LEPT|nr:MULTISPECIES: preprotein translocase subunit SecE [Leptospira]EPG73421.1 preprotein translocase, SecE subunit [Leptospira fainei serovar Hurstbridge str. BUT 6]EQA37689.1 preprotein translocase, SecE subunit [Leptospira inadai serovar Lyme str. 10]EQA44497.1 preprotein translocase, SecE subunit [Leptospira broomii serovar Hurstbridge str. 5399]PNV74959.1 preprotein translocase subunit SecE [Leptospira inadai serovar Lyme]
MKLNVFIQECREELKKVQWPNRQEVVQSTFVVLATVLFFSTFLFLSDMAFVRLLTGFWNL